MDSGKKANTSGSNLESFVENILIKYNYLEFSREDRHYFLNCKDELGGRWYAKQAYIGKSIYDTDRFCDFLIYDETEYKDFLAIECKWQSSSGSVDEKYPFLVYNIIYSKIDTIIILDGGGYKPGSKKWLYKIAKEATRLKMVCSMSEFQKAVNSGLIFS